MTRLQHPRTTGFTVVEATVVVAVMAIVTALAAPSIASFLQTRRLESASQWLQSDLAWLRAQALARQETLRWSLLSSTSGHCWIIHTGDPGPCTCRFAEDLRAAPASCAGETLVLKHGALPVTDGVALRGNVNTMRVDPHLGTFTPTGSLDLTTPTGHHIRQVVNVLGRVRLCSTARTLGLPAC